MLSYDSCFFFDESGEKGYLEKKPLKKAISVIAGFAFPSESLISFEQKLNYIFRDLETNTMRKLHATEIFKNSENQHIKTRLFNFILEEKLLVIYEAISCYGFYREQKELKKFKQEGFKKTAESNIKLSKINKKENIYHIVLEGLLVKLDEMCRIEGNSRLRMVTENIDEKMFKEAIKKLNFLKQQDHTYRVTGFDTSKQEVVLGTIKIEKIKGMDVNINNIKEIKIEKETSRFTLVADIIANLIYRHLKKKIEENSRLGLNSKKIMENFSLAKKIAFLDDDYFIDKIYKLE